MISYWLPLKSTDVYISIISKPWPMFKSKFRNQAKFLDPLPGIRLQSLFRPSKRTVHLHMSRPLQFRILVPSLCLLCVRN